MNRPLSTAWRDSLLPLGGHHAVNVVPPNRHKINLLGAVQPHFVSEPSFLPTNALRKLSGALQLLARWARIVLPLRGSYRTEPLTLDPRVPHRRAQDHKRIRRPWVRVMLTTAAVLPRRHGFR